MSDRETATRRDVARTALVALVARLLVALVVWNRFPPADDGVIYDALARRLAHGLGYTWAWPDGAVTAVAHYPVGYPVLLALAYRLLGDHPASALLMQSAIGAVGAVSVHVVAASTSRRAGRWAGLAVALHPALLAYTPALMTEGVTSALLAVPFALAVVARDSPGRPWTWALLAGLALGGVSLVRPQAVLLLPVVAWLAVGTRQPRLGPVFVTAGALLSLTPWFVRNERVFGRPVLVSANGGWNLLIGTDGAAHGGWRALDVPAECRQVWGEVEKDACFGQVARDRIVGAPGRWLRLVPEKLATTFDVGGSGLSYLSRARPDRVSRGMVVAAGAVETLIERVMVLVCVVLLGFEPGPRSHARRALAVLSGMWLLTWHAWPAYAGLAALLCLGGPRRLAERPLEVVTCAVLVATIVTHAVFFGAGRYALIVQPWVAALAVSHPDRLRAAWTWMRSAARGVVRDSPRVTRASSRARAAAPSFRSSRGSPCSSPSRAPI